MFNRLRPQPLLVLAVLAATLVVVGHIVHEDAMCGVIEGMVMSPIEWPLAGSNFAAIRLDDDGCTPETLPTPLP